MSINALGVVTINSTQQVNHDGAPKTALSKTPVALPHAASEDTTSFTSDKQTVQSLSQTALQTFPSRQVKVETLKLAVNSAQYQLDSAKIAASLANADE